jgi:hypothetical protein
MSGTMGAGACGQIVHHCNVKGRSGRQGEYNEQKDETGGEMEALFQVVGI